MLYNFHDMYIGRSLDLYGEYSEEEVALFRQIVRPGDFVVEVGANYGAHTIFLARHVGPEGRVVAFEPQRIVFQALCANVALNNLSNVIALHEAVGAESGSIKVPTLDFARINNFGGMSLGKYEVGEEVPVVTLDSKPMKRCNFLKIDVEGMEEQVLRGAVHVIERFQPVMYVENDKPEKSDDLVRFIDSLSYNMYWHKPYYFSPNNFFGNPENVFPNVASFNMVCVHKSIPQNLQGFEPVEVPQPQPAKT